MPNSLEGGGVFIPEDQICLPVPREGYDYYVPYPPQSGPSQNKSPYPPHRDPPQSDLPQNRGKIPHRANLNPLQSGPPQIGPPQSNKNNSPQNTQLKSRSKTPTNGKQKRPIKKTAHRTKWEYFTPRNKKKNNKTSETI